MIKNNGVIGKIDELGRITISMDLRQNLGLTSGEYMEVTTGEQGFTLGKYTQSENGTTPTDTVIKRLDELGRIVIPAEIREKLDISIGDEIEISSNGTKINCVRK